MSKGYRLTQPEKCSCRDLLPWLINFFRTMAAFSSCHFDPYHSTTSKVSSRSSHSTSRLNDSSIISTKEESQKSRGVQQNHQNDTPRRGTSSPLSFKL